MKKVDFIGIGGSAGSLSKMINIIENLPSSNISIFIVLHRGETKESILPSILQNVTTKYKVCDPYTNQKIMPKTIYTAPAGKHMIAENGHIILTNSSKIHFSRPSISVLFDSLAKEYKNNLLSILLCGYGDDGSDSLKYLESSGSTILIEDAKECEATPMLDNAVKDGHYDAILPISGINKYIYNAIQNNLVNI